MEGNPLAKLAMRIRVDVFSSRTLLALTVGVLSGVVVVVSQMSLGAVVFSGPLAAYSSAGVGLVLFGSFVICLVLAFASGFQGAVSAPPVSTVVMLAVISGAIAGEADVVFATMVAIIVLCAFATALCTWLIGHFRLANLVRFIPYPVSAGFVAGTGGVACLVALSLMGVKLELSAPTGFLEPHVVANWGVGMVYGVGLYLATKRWRSYLLLPVSFGVTGALFHLGLSLADVSADQAGRLGLLFGVTSDGRLWPAFGFGDLSLVDWAVVAGQVPNMLTLVLVTLVCMVMYVGGLELARNRELDWNREFRAAGYANILAGLGGGPPGCLLVPPSLRSLMFNVDIRLTGVAAAILIGATMLLGDALLKLVPVPLMGGVLIFTGLVMLDEWLVRVRRRVPTADYAIIVAMFITIVTLGFFEGVGVGMLITIVFFLVRLSRVDLIENQYNASERHSKRIRPVPDRAILKSEGPRVQAYRLHGYLFFGSGYPLCDHLKRSLGRAPQPLCVLLDFEAVSGFDFSSVHALCRFMNDAHGAGTRVVLCAAPERFRDELRLNLAPAALDNLLFEPDADLGLERCEDMLIADHAGADRAAVSLERVADAIERHLDRQVWFEELMESLGDWVEARTYDVGASIVTIDQPATGVQLMTAGRASLYDAAGHRLAQCGPGDVLGSHGAFGPRTSIHGAVADETCSTVMLTPAALGLLEDNNPTLALELYRYLLGNEGQVSMPRQVNA